MFVCAVLLRQCFGISALLACIYSAAVSDGEERGRVEETEGGKVTKVINQTPQRDAHLRVPKPVIVERLLKCACQHFI